ncbi:putative dolichyl-diphosphooligosaccharide--protein glycosyltransferase subunit 3B [Bidens hawaiensis]|uniref:putative dolichyl-diphosphooligosaccharide--protein glycosyltransferase subunit 3B n=1 Tax=Bidens hawaiensis TaxID=980011 RepID=UPI00404A4543
MAISTKPTLIPLILILTIITHSSTADTIFSDLHSLRSHSPSSIIHLNQTLINRVLKSTPKPFLIIFFDAVKLHNQPEPNLKTIKSEFALVSKSFIINNRNTSLFHKIFFCDIELGESKHNLIRFGVRALPDIRIVPPDAKDLKLDSIPIVLGDYPGIAESMADFIGLRTGISIGAIHRPPIVTKTQLGLVIGGFLMWMPFVVKKVFFFKGNGMQFGVEGFCVGFLFTVVGLLLSLVTRIVVKMKHSAMQRVTMIGVMGVSFWAVKQVVKLNNWKTGYAVHTYMPSSWYK